VTQHVSAGVPGSRPPAMSNVRSGGLTRVTNPVPPLFWFRDPDGNTLMVVESR
jgi:hypothetical protein